MNAEPLLGALFGLVLLGLAGRALLAWLPPGELGGHAPGSLPHTWAASHLLGFVAFHTAAGAAAELGLRFGWVAFAGVAAALAGLRLGTLPAPMVPQHPLRAPHDSPGSTATGSARASRWAFAACLVLVPVAALASGELGWPTAPGELAGWRANTPAEAAVLRLLRPAHLIALALLVDHGLAPLGLAPAWRRLAALAAAVPAALSPELQALAPLPADQDPAAGALARTAQLALTFGAGAALAVRWFLRAEARVLALALIAFAACLAEAPDGVALGLAGLASLALALHRPALQGLAPALLAALAVSLPWQLVRLALALVDCPGPGAPSLAAAVDTGGLRAALCDWRTAWSAGGLLYLALPFLAVRAARRAPAHQRAAGRFLVALAILALGLHAPLVAAAACLPSLDPDWGEALRRAAPAPAALAALALAASAGTGRTEASGSNPGGTA